MQTAVATRDPRNELLTSTPGTPYPHVRAQVGQYDRFQWTDETIAGIQTVTPQATTGGFPPDSLYIGRGGHTEPDSAWDYSVAEKDYLDDANVAYLHNYLGPYYSPTLTPSSTPTGTYNTPTPFPTPAAVEALADYFKTSTPAPTPNFAQMTATSWPPGPTTDLQLFLHPGGTLNPSTPATAEGYDTIGQDYTPGATYWNMGTAAAENVGQTPAFNTWDDHIKNSGLTVTYVSAPLAQTVLLVGPPRVNLYASPSSGYDYPIQVHVRVRERLPQVSGDPYITSANACRWLDVDDTSWFNGENVYGETRVHRFIEGSRIVVELTTVDEEYYYPAKVALFMTPYLGEMRVDVFHRQDKPTSVTLPILPDNPNDPIFETGGGAGPSDAPQRDPQPAAKPSSLEPLNIEAQLRHDYTNPGGWRAWAPQVWIRCTGGEGTVSCPEDTVLATDGINQTFTFTTTDSAGHTDTVTLSGISIDRTPPAATINLSPSQTFCSGATTEVDFSVSDALSGMAESQATFNGVTVTDGNIVSLAAGANVLKVTSADVAGNHTANQATIQVNYNTTLEFPTDGDQVNPLLPLSFAFKVNDTCAGQSWYNGAAGTLWLISPSGVEQPAEWYGLPTGNSFVLNSLTGWYDFDADLTGLTPGTWTARADLDDGTSRSVTFVIPAAGPNTPDTATLTPALSLGGGGLGRGLAFDCAADLARDGRYLGGCR